MSAVRVKICGMTNWDDAQAAIELGADALGFVFAPSPRQVSPQAARQIIEKLPPLVTTVGVFVDEKPEAVTDNLEVSGCMIVQLHGQEPPEYLEKLEGRPVIKALKVKSAEDLEVIAQYQSARAFLLDTYVAGKAGGTGESFDWELAANANRFGKPIILAGGLSPDNVRQAIETVRPYAVDVSSAVEASPGKKDHRLIKEFIECAKGA